MTNKKELKKEIVHISDDADKVLNKNIEQKIDQADEKWEKVKDKTSGVNKELERKLEAGTVDPKDLDTQGG